MSHVSRELNKSTPDCISSVIGTCQIHTRFMCSYLLHISWYAIISNKLMQLTHTLTYPVLFHLFQHGYQKRQLVLNFIKQENQFSCFCTAYIHASFAVQSLLFLRQSIRIVASKLYVQNFDIWIEMCTTGQLTRQQELKPPQQD